MSERINLTRRQLAEALGTNHDTIVQFEKLVQMAGTITPEQVDILFSLINRLPPGVDTQSHSEGEGEPGVPGLQGSPGRDGVSTPIPGDQGPQGESGVGALNGTNVVFQNPLTSNQVLLARDNGVVGDPNLTYNGVLTVTGANDAVLARSALTNASTVVMGTRTGSGYVYLQSNFTGAGSTLPLAMFFGATEAARFTATGINTNFPVQLITTGAASVSGNATLVAGTITINTTAVTANSKILLTRKAIGGTVGATTYTIIAGVSFTINSDNALDTSTFTWAIFEGF